MDDNKIIYKLALALVSGVGSGLAQNLISHVGSVDDIFSEKPSSLQKIPGIGPNITKNIGDEEILKRAENELAFIRKNKISLCFFKDEDYPVRLRDCSDAPIILFYKGTLETHPKKTLSIIGTRNPTRRGRQITREWVKEIADKDKSVVIISGLAYGIDIQAHEAALDFGLKTYAGLGHGFHTIYPAIHRSTAKRIIERGALLTDFFSYSRMEPKNFIRRNRLIAGLSDLTLVVESKEKGGAMVTADMANSYNRDVMAIPGRPGDLMSAGCNKLIKLNEAALVQSVDDIFFLMGWDKFSKKPKSFFSQPDVELNEKEKLIFSLIASKKAAIDQLSLETNIPVAQLSPILLSLEFKGLISAQPGNTYIRQ